MGILNSKESTNTAATPPRSSVPKRILEFDPRSPSSEILRTPILVEKTPEGLLDPRSPTPGILRTPLNTLDGHVPHERVPLMPSLLLEDAGDKEPEDNSLEDTSLEDTDQLLQEFDSLQQMSITEKPTLPLNESVSLIYHDEETDDSHGYTKPQQSRQLFSGNKKHNKDLTRSPLSMRNVDVNSPRIIVQRKQTKKVENAKFCLHDAVSGKISVHDKENLEF